MEMKELDGSDNITTCTDSSGEEDRETRRNSKASGGGGQRSRRSESIKHRPNASAGFWLACLLPLAYVTNYLHGLPICNARRQLHQLLTVAVVGMAVESFCFFMYLFYDTGIVFKLLISLMPGAFASLLFATVLEWPCTIAVPAGIGITLCYQNVYMRALRGLPQCFTFGEAAVLVQGLFVFVLSASLQLFNAVWLRVPLPDDFAKLNLIMLSALLCLLCYCCALWLCPFLRRTLPFYALSALLLVAVTCMPIMQPLPILTLLTFLLKDQLRLLIIAFYLLLVALTIGTVAWQLSNATKANTRVRKIFHVLIVLVYLPGLLYECSLLYLATGVAFAFFTVIELVRVLEVPPLAGLLKSAFATFKDEKDAGLLALTPFYLLIGCSLPIWLTPCPCNTLTSPSLSMLSGILAVGFGDTAASVIGSKLGRFKWHDSSRTLEGTVAFASATLLGVYGLNFCGLLPMTQSQWFFVVIATFISALVEAYTDQIDNLALPLTFYIFVNLA